MNFLQNNYKESVRHILIVDIEHLKKHKIEMKESLLHLKTIIFAKSKRLEEELNELRTRNAVNLHDIVFSVKNPNFKCTNIKKFG